MTWWWQGGHFHVVLLAMVGVWVCSRWRERDGGGRKRERIRKRRLFFLVIYFGE